ncbi:MAG: hypothetical protein HY286_13605 [Planctomycetes bacterium]|nr:hypothetical protein [Planctomycetota bacterium]
MKSSRSQAGVSAIEVVIAAAILVLISLNMAMILKTSTSAFKSETMQRVVGDQAEMTMDRISYAVMASSEKELYPVKNAPTNTPTLEYQTCLGYENGQLIMGDVERIEYIMNKGSVVWTQCPDTQKAHAVVWTNWVPHNLDGETNNGIDDNGNGLVDENGLSFDSVGPKVNIHLTVQRASDADGMHKKTVTNTVTCRN